MTEIFNIILYQPLFNLLVFFYNIIPGQDIGVAILVMTFLIKFVLYPLTRKTIVSQRQMQELQPKIKEIQEKHKNDKSLQAQETMKLYKDYGVHPLGGCLPLLVQLPILLALFSVFRTGFEADALDSLYSFISNPGQLDPFFFGILDLSERSIIVAFLAGGIQFLHSYLITKPKTTQKPEQKKKEGGDMAQMIQKQMTYMMPILTFVFSLSFPAALPFYWFVNTGLSIGEHYIPANKGIGNRVQDKINTTLKP